MWVQRIMPPKYFDYFSLFVMVDDDVGILRKKIKHKPQESIVANGQWPYTSFDYKHGTDNGRKGSSSDRERRLLLHVKRSRHFGGKFGVTVEQRSDDRNCAIQSGNGGIGEFNLMHLI
ncbi:hypothetical protein QJS04_geneDACA007036 [Acorus gramineus]|uniref:Uncharacterized protein n=1 Tax=Acorus gramineus TaxID=55184 RepID=A0AAV9BM63_ACOGR|nr:hypothetical protein QJS04_geneDACA007036 [Acorus gramineus]